MDNIQERSYDSNVVNVNVTPSKIRNRSDDRNMLCSHYSGEWKRNAHACNFVNCWIVSCQV